MRKHILGICLSSFFTVSAWATPFSGFYGGADVGLSQANFKKSQTVELILLAGTTPVTDVSFLADKNLADTSFLGNIDLGFSHVFYDFLYLGLEASYDFQNLTVKNDPLTKELESEFHIDYVTGANLRDEFALTFNPGIVLNKKTLFYGKVGPAWGRFSVHGDAHYYQNIGAEADAYSAFKHNDFYRCGLRLGLGIEQYVAERMTLKLELVNTEYYTIHSPNPMTAPVGTVPPDVGFGGELSNSNKIKANNTSVLFGFNYYFT